MMSMMNPNQAAQQVSMSSGNNQMQPTLEGLPSQFVSSMRTLFDIMDESRTGCVLLSDIETRWREDESQLLPKGVIECLRKVTPPNGMLSFERFCAGLRICLLRNRRSDDKEIPGRGHLKSAPSTSSSLSSSSSSIPNLKKVVPSQTVTPINITRPTSKPDTWSASDSDTGMPALKIPPSPSGSSNSSLAGSSSSQNYRNSGSVTATVRPNISSQQRTVSMPLLGNNHQPQNNNLANRSGISSSGAAHGSTNLGISSLIGEYGRGNTAAGSVGRMYQSETRISGVVESPVNNGKSVPNRRGIMTVLHNWHMGMLQEAQKSGSIKTTAADKVNFEKNAGAADNNPDFRVNMVKDNLNQNKGSLRRREPRRHTLANGIDYNMLKRMKQLEQEKDVLLQGLEAVEKTRGWYIQQIDEVQEKMKYIGQNSTLMEYSTEAHQERLNFQMAQIFEVNQHLSVLVESSQRGYPLHMNLAVRQPSYFSRPIQQPPQDSVVVNQLKEQTVSLSSEVGQKNERILQLEREKAALVRELFQARAHSRRESNDTTLM